ncbi:MAG TPA: O-antigen ligase family protein [Actinobacteria bacterium]|nr:O-antigen ligase family protein [Actinomycetota bacterium]
MYYRQTDLKKFRNLNMSSYIRNAVFFLFSFIFISFYYSKIFSSNNMLSLAAAVTGLAVYIVSLINIKKGVYFFIFLIPLFGSLPKILNAPETPVILFLFFFLFLAFLLKKAKNHLMLAKREYLPGLNEKGELADRYYSYASHYPDNSFNIAVLLFCLLAFVSAAVTVWRFSNFYPFITGNYYNFKVNTLGQGSTDSIYWTVKYFFNYIAGFGLLYVIVNTFNSIKDILKAFLAVFISVILIFAVFFYQLLVNPAFGNFQMWVDAQRFNSVFSDPNSLGNFIIMVFPVLPGLMIYFKKWWQKLLTLACIAIILVLFLFAGSRNAFIGIFLSTLVFIIIFLIRGLVKLGRKIRFKTNPAKTAVIITIIAILIIGALISPFYIIKKGGILDEIDKPKTNISLVNRMVSTIWMSYNTYVLADLKEAFKSVSSFRYALWNQARDMSMDFPVTGVGAGAFIIELPDYYERNKSEVREIDYAGNYYLQLMSELGIPALLLMLFIFFVVARDAGLCLVRNKKKKDFSINKKTGKVSVNGKENRDKWLLTGLLVSFSVMVLILFLGPHMNFFEILFYFYLLIGLIFVFIKDSEISGHIKKTVAGFKKINHGSHIKNVNEDENNYEGSKGRGITAAILIAAIVLIYMANFLFISVNKISIANKQNSYGIDNNFGFYSQEKADNHIYRWTSSDAGLTIKKESNRLVIPLRAANPDIESKNLAVNIFVNNKKERKIIFNDNEWKETVIDVSGYYGENISVIFSCSMTWCPEEFGIKDGRRLGVAVGEIRFPD